MKNNNEVEANLLSCDTNLLLDEAIEKATRLCEITKETQTVLANKKVGKLNWVLLATSGGLVLANVILLLRQLL